MRICVIIPAFNEGPSIRKVVEEIDRSIVEEVIVVSNGSTDNTEQEAQEAGAIVLTEKRKGYGWACLRGIAYASDNHFELIVFMDGDHADYADEMPLLIDPILTNKADFVIGSRVGKYREKGSMTPQQVFGNWLATRLIRIFYGFRFTDLGPYRAIRTSSLLSLKMADKTYGWTIEMQIKAIKKKLRIKEVEVHYRQRIGVSKVSGTIKGTIMAGIKITFAVLKYRF
ncbi:MAG: glycosyltransferase family 2 protein [Bacteroidetes bacterium]|nr:MAG: glycosyltransferase family 2 protein [Bacteroidota bacterium]